MKVYSALSKESEGVFITGDGIMEIGEDLYIYDSMFGTSGAVIKETLSVMEVEKDINGNIIYAGPPRKDPNKIDITSREYVSKQFDIPPVSQDVYRDEYDKGTSEESREDFEDFDDPLKKLID